MTEQEMLKEALEWQEHIRKLVTATDDELYHKRSKVFDWILEQAEKVEQLQHENERLKKFLNWEQEEAQGLDEEVTFQLEQLKQAQAKAERYKHALEFYADENNYREQELKGIVPPRPITFKPILHDYGSIARQALEEEI